MQTVVVGTVCVECHDAALVLMVGNWKDIWPVKCPIATNVRLN